MFIFCVQHAAILYTSRAVICTPRFESVGCTPLAVSSRYFSRGDRDKSEDDYFLQLLHLAIYYIFARTINCLEIENS